jgi:DHA1 family tetracycline resistance protein-like MFS transporter
MLGVGIIIPVIPAVFYSRTALHFSQIHNANELRWAYCSLMASFSFMLFFGAPILGTLSDRFGRKKIIQASLIGTAIGYSLFSFAVHSESLLLLFLSRIIPGFFAGSLSVLFSAISDISSPDDKPKNFALIWIAFGIGFLFGSRHRWNSIRQYHTALVQPLYALCFYNMSRVNQLDSSAFLFQRDIDDIYSLKNYSSQRCE